MRSRFIAVALCKLRLAGCCAALAIQQHQISYLTQVIDFDRTP